jgi:hypothetical protein
MLFPKKNGYDDDDDDDDDDAISRTYKLVDEYQLPPSMETGC